MNNEYLNVSLKVIQNPQYKVEPVLAPGKKIAMRPDDLIGIKLKWAKTNQIVWQRNNGVILMKELAPESQDYIYGRFTNTKMLEVFGGLGD